MSFTDRGTRTSRRDERGVALVIVLLTMMLLSALGLALSLTAITESRIAASYRGSAETIYAADAGIERALHDLSLVSDWTAVLTGAATAPFIDGAAGARRLPDGSPLDLNRATDDLNCGHPSCSDADLIATTAERPWGANNPVWRLYEHARFGALSSSRVTSADVYVVVWVADDPLENDGLPFVDGDESRGPNPGRGLVQIRAHAYGPAGAQRIVEATIRRAGSRVDVLSWRERRQ